MDRDARTPRRKETQTIMSDANAAVENGSDSQMISLAAERLQVTPKAGSSNNTRRRKAAPKPKRSAPSAGGRKSADRKTVSSKPSKTARKQPESRPGSKTAEVLELIGRSEGATLQQLREATGWQNHSVRGFLSGAVGKRLGLKLKTGKNQAGERIYRLEK